MRRSAIRVAFWLLAVSWLLALTANARVPEAANGYKRLLSAEAESAWGLNAPIARLAAQIHQESGWRPTARSKYAAGLTQFTPGTAADMGKWYPSELQPVDPDNPQWAIRAMVMYNQRLLNSIFPMPKSASIPECDHWAMTLASYNGGIGNLRKELRLCESAGQNAPCAPNGSKTKSSPVSIAQARTGLAVGGMGGDNLSDFGRVGASKEMIGLTKPTMFSVVFSLRHYGEITRTKVGPVLVDMMNEDTAIELGEHQLFGYKSVNVVIFPFNVDTRIAVVQKNTLGIVESERAEDVSQIGVKISDSHDSVRIPSETSCVKCDPTLWWGHVERFSARADWAFKENREYPLKILTRWEPMYLAAGWPGVSACQ